MPGLNAPPHSPGIFNAVQLEAAIRHKTPGSARRFERSQRTLAGGVSSGLRRSARPYPLFFTHGEGAKLHDVDGNSYLDYGLAWGPLILGHAHPAIVEAVQAQAAKGLTFGAQHDLEYEVSEMLSNIIPCADLICYANSGTEIVQLALRLARAWSGRLKHLKFEGHYHGWSDEVLVSYHPSADDPEGQPAPVGRGQAPHDHVLIAPWNDCAAVEQVFAEHGHELSAVICEPLLANSGCIPPEPGFLEFLREVTTRNRTVLIFDEVITGFRIDLRGAQGRWGVIPDLATYAKALGGGAVVSALAGRSEFMRLIADGPVVHAGTLNGNPVTLAATKATLEVLSSSPGLYPALRKRAGKLRSGIQQALAEAGLPAQVSGDGPVFLVAFMTAPARNYRDTLRANLKLQNEFALALLNEGVLTLPDGRWYVSAVHTEEQIDQTLESVRRALGLS